MSKPKAGNLEPGPMEYEYIVMPNPNNERGRLAREANEITKAELVERAGPLGIDTRGSKDDVAERVRDAARND